MRSVNEYQSAITEWWSTSQPGQRMLHLLQKEGDLPVARGTIETDVEQTHSEESDASV